MARENEKEKERKKSFLGVIANKCVIYVKHQINSH